MGIELKYRRWVKGSVLDANQFYLGRWEVNGRVSELRNRKMNGGVKGSTLKGYKRWLWGEMQNKFSPVMDELLDIVQYSRRTGKPVVLSCHCESVKTCHCSVVAKALRYIDSKWDAEYANWHDFTGEF